MHRVKWISSYDWITRDAKLHDADTCTGRLRRKTFSIDNDGYEV